MIVSALQMEGTQRAVKVFRAAPGVARLAPQEHGRPGLLRIVQLLCRAPGGLRVF